MKHQAHTQSPIVIAVASLIFAAGWAGCGNSSDAVKVRGRVTFREQPLNNAGIVFFPETGRPVSAVVSEGAYTTRLSPGSYTIVINVGVELPPGYKEGDPLPPPKILLPAKYASRATSTLRASVSADQSEPIDFKLD